MIKSHDRSHWFGASDTAMIMSNWNTLTFSKWWLVKLGVWSNNFSTLSMQAGTAYEHRILSHIGITHTDRQIKVPWLRLRVNLDGEDAREISEVKTHSSDAFRVSKAYWQQCQVEMFASGVLRRRKACRIVAYRLLREDIENWYRPIEDFRLSYWPIEYDRGWISNEYLPRLKYLAWCLRRGKWPAEWPVEGEYAT